MSEHLSLIRMFISLFLSIEFLQLSNLTSKRKNWERVKMEPAADRDPHVSNMLYSVSLSVNTGGWGLPESRLYVLVSTQQAMHPIQRILLTSAQGWRTIFCLRSEGERTCTLAKPAARQTYIAFGSVVAVYFFPSLLCMICLPNTCLECDGGCAARSLPVPEDARR